MGLGPQLLHHATETADIWRTAAVYKGCPSRLFPPLCREDGTQADTPETKAQVFQAKFFPNAPRAVPTHHPSDPPPQEPRTWTPITSVEVTATLHTAAHTVPGPSGVGYKTLKWAHEARPDYLPHLLNLCLNLGYHPWKTTTVVMINKPQKLDYTVPKAYRPIALLECTGKLLKKIVAKRINADIEQYNLLPMTQFRSRPKHNAINAVASLVHKIQGTIATGHAGALLLFNISGFFNNVNPSRATAILWNKGFPPSICAWTLSFLTGRKAAIHMGNYVSEPFPILNGTPQGSPLSPILSALYTSSLLDIAKTWRHADLSLYVDNSAIYTISATLKAATESARSKYETVLTWLHDNGLQTDTTKTKLMTFTPKRANPKFVGPPIQYMAHDTPSLPATPTMSRLSSPFDTSASTSTTASTGPTTSPSWQTMHAPPSAGSPS